MKNNKVKINFIAVGTKEDLKKVLMEYLLNKIQIPLRNHGAYIEPNTLDELVRNNLRI